MKNYNDKKICFIICFNNDLYLNECLMYINYLNVPQGYIIEVLTISDAKSMTSGYNEGMNASDAKYKIYLHQDTFITNRNFISDVINIFKKDVNVGIIGMIGAPILARDGVMWHERRCGDFYRLDELIESGVDGIEKVKKGIKDVDVVDGLLIATQYDISWREDILKGWDFYDVSQCLEFKRRGYKVVVPAQNPSWTNHKCGVPSFWNYNYNREIVLKEYPEIEENKPRRILYYHSDAITLLGLAMGLDKIKYKVDVAAWEVKLSSYNERDYELIVEDLEEGNYDLVVTYDFCPSIAKACKDMNVKYFAWVYDSPLLELYLEQAEYDTNYFLIFDKKQYEMLLERGLKNMYHMPLASEVDIFGSVSIKKKEEKKYISDVSFVGRLYNKRGYEELFDEVYDKELKAEADIIVESCNCMWDGKTNLYGKASDQLINHIVNKMGMENYKIDPRYYAESMKLVRRCNEIERFNILNRLSEHYKVTLYTDNVDVEGLPKVDKRPWVDYWNEMPKVFYMSKINLNISSRSIESGIPQRVFDIMAVGGFVLTNYQPEIEEYFVIGEDLDVYHNVNELIEKVGFYLKHEDVRIRMAMNGYQKVRKYHTYENRLRVILNDMLNRE